MEAAAGGGGLGRGRHSIVAVVVVRVRRRPVLDLQVQAGPGRGGGRALDGGVPETRGVVLGRVGKCGAPHEGVVESGLVVPACNEVRLG